MDDFVVGENLRSLDGVDQLADIARPLVTLDRFERSGFNPPIGLLKEVDKERNIAVAFAQRREIQREVVDPIEEVLAKTPQLH